MIPHESVVFIIGLCLTTYIQSVESFPHLGVINRRITAHPYTSTRYIQAKRIQAQQSDDNNNLMLQQQNTISIRHENFSLRPSNETNMLLDRRRFYRPWRKLVKYKKDDMLSFHYDYNELLVAGSSSGITDDSSSKPKKTRIILLIQPIGVGIGRWYYDRLLHQFESGGNELLQERGNSEYDYVFLSPDLLGCGSACHPYLTSANTNSSLSALPLFSVNDWSEQLISLMSTYERANNQNEVEWCIISNGGCVPIALEIATRYIRSESSNASPKIIKGRLTNLILSATPRAMSLMRPQNFDKIRKSYKTLSGVVGDIFWWYSLRRNGVFIQKFSEKNLAAKAENLGEEWTPKCVETAKAFQGRSRFSTFAFLAGSLNGGNEERVSVLKENSESRVGIDMEIDIITGGDKRVNPAKSWFWQNRKETKKAENLTRQKDQAFEKTSLLTLFLESGIKCKEIIVSGRRCPAHEDARGFARAIATILRKQR